MNANARNIKIHPKATSASTTYYDMNKDDEGYIYQWLMRFMANIAEEATFDSEIQREFFKRRPNTFPKGKNGPNSIASMLGGIVSAKLQNPNKNLSEPQLDVVEMIFDQIEKYYANDPDAPKTVRFQKSLFEGL